AGLLYPEDDQTYRIAHRFDPAEVEAINQVHALKSGLLPFDPTIDRLLKTRVAPPDILAHLAKGGVWIVPILGFAVLATSIGVAKMIQFSRLPRLVPVMPQMLERNREITGTLAGPQREIVSIVRSAESIDQRDDVLFAYLNMERRRLERFLGAIAVTATVAPLLGLLGTVSGMISTFNMMTLFGAGDPSVVSGGISEALVTTELGLIVAIPALILHALLSRKATTYVEGLEASAIALTQTNPAETEQ
ncbi:MAG: MotA/TolQ/ExbB proton channel family protein, partial [Pseudomonadota bacterium]